MNENISNGITFENIDWFSKSMFITILCNIRQQLIHIYIERFQIPLILDKTFKTKRFYNQWIIIFCFQDHQKLGYGAMNGIPMVATSPGERGIILIVKIFVNGQKLKSSPTVSLQQPTDGYKGYFLWPLDDRNNGQWSLWPRTSSLSSWCLM